jgi:SAM-dependent methyltransferase
MNDLGTQYATGLSRQHIEQALIAAGKDPGRLQPADLGMLEDFHTMGRIATSQLAELASITSDDHVLDVGSGIGGTARFLAGQYGCRATAIDLTEEYCDTARWLNGLDGLISVRQGDVTGLPFADATFQVVISQHVQMNVPDKARLYTEARRVLVPVSGWKCEPAHGGFRWPAVTAPWPSAGGNWAGNSGTRQAGCRPPGSVA